MLIHRHLEEYAGLPVYRFDEETEPDDDLPPAAGTAWCVATCFDEDPFDDVFARFLDAVDTTEVTALAIGYWGADYDQGAADPAALLAEAAAVLPKLRAVFLGDMTFEESEISWIQHSDISPLLAAFPDLERLDVRGAAGLVLDPVKSANLKTLRFESGGLPAQVVRAVGASDLPSLAHLDLWFGVDDYGGDATVADLAPLLSGERLPALRRLGLEDSEIQDEIAAAIADAPVVARLESLSLAMGTLSDEGAEALLSGQPLTHLRELDLHHHFLTDPMMERLKAALPGVKVNVDEQDPRGDGRRYVAVAE
ncbi:leucine-rich repeat domain-containing protein [Actinomadura sp. KC345]|uniref:STM4015 family protein n=1 Tax=Actinomadura sp. KC345 TaxID=2530371 RepID=UPI00104799EB|nr:STM4015 family protein [Actinomadura sp. KC345]TDC53046.1 leucine-rich repeat domain-containing protein [Actinomadura sp. KC345]